jgi:hypothetical protein
MSIVRAHMQLIMQELEKRQKSKSRAEAEFFLPGPRGISASKI